MRRVLLPDELEDVGERLRVTRVELAVVADDLGPAASHLVELRVRLVRLVFEVEEVHARGLDADLLRHVEEARRDAVGVVRVVGAVDEDRPVGLLVEVRLGGGRRIRAGGTAGGGGESEREAGGDASELGDHVHLGCRLESEKLNFQLIKL